MTIELFLLDFFGGGGGVKMCDKMAISACILKIVEKDPFLRLQMRAKEDSSPIFLEYFRGKDEILVKLRLKGLNYHNFSHF